jgi:acyl-[acyl-carrier-protein] desaturase
MMKKKIIMPAHYLRELGVDLGSTFNHFSDAAQRLGVYTANDYVDILESLLKLWSIDKVADLNEAGEKARDYLMKLPDRLRRVSERLKIPESTYEYTWIGVKGD